jgi:hypothetical protein
MFGKLVALMFAASYLTSAPAIAQVVNKTTQELKKDNSVPPATGRGASEQAGTIEPSSKVRTSEDENVFRNGVLTAPGASSDLDTAPSKFSARTSADDDLPIAAYRLKGLSNEQRRDIVQQLAALGGGTPVSQPRGNYATIGRELSARIALQALTPVPLALAAQYPELMGTSFMSSENGILIVDSNNNFVVGVLDR